MPNFIDAIKGLMSGNQADATRQSLQRSNDQYDRAKKAGGVMGPDPAMAAFDPTMADVLAKNPQALPSEIYGQLHGQKTSDINLPQSPMNAARQRLQTILQSLKLP